MAAVSWRLTSVLKSSLWSSRAIGPLFRGRAITRYYIPQATPILYRQYSSKDIEVTLTPEEKKISDRMDRGYIRRFFDWMNSDPEPIEEVFSEEERLKREDLDRRLNEMLYSNPPIKPDLAFVTEMIETMMTYSNWYMGCYV
ncbi:PREDICTED: uncharacterized protein LOC100633942 isoform X2 [Amphimedon queenslandica]|uniref:Uncharacterized protein n=1 Tax=Amphimedon queenslandica TaxID=400682 RepID=A0AAN0JCA6_AMPQE|nr:PREDICTED: uncharacterized protein LOC100633942 isoform X2 [Amphimedon queenslandica]|eukprot:XP_019854376.1 PREDICTED: uncharacterized protein LOC100633942 isoform X2 [Amphimedon queenslandica]